MVSLSINKKYAERLIREYPLLREVYESKVPEHNTDEECWDDFLKKNNKYQTVVFGGNNPIFYPL